MRKLLLVLVLAGLLVLALSVPALAGPDNENSAKWFGQMHQFGNWNGNPPPFPGGVDPLDTPGHRTTIDIPGGPPPDVTGNPGQSIKQVVEKYLRPAGLNWGDFIQSALHPES